MVWATIRMVPGLTAATGVLCAGIALVPGMGAAEAKEAKKRDPSKTVCQTIIPSGTRLGKRICRTQQEWDDEARAAQDGVFDQQRVNPLPPINPN